MGHGKRHSPQQIITKLREADAMLAGEASLGQVCQQLSISEATLHRWRHQYGGLKSSDAKRLKEFAQENGRLKRLVANQALDILILKEAARPN